jgi:hypothetical protein
LNAGLSRASAARVRSKQRFTVASSFRLLEFRPVRENEGMPEPSIFELAPIDPPPIEPRSVRLVRAYMSRTQMVAAWVWW